MIGAAGEHLHSFSKDVPKRRKSRCQVRFFQWDTLGVLTAVEFDEVQKNQRTKIKRSTCRLAFRTSKKPYKTLGWEKLPSGELT